MIQVHGGKREFRPLAGTTYAFVDAWGVQAKRLFGGANPFRKRRLRK